jgi:hypothetical protein
MSENITAAGSPRRQIPEDYRYNPKKLKHLKRILHNLSVALGTLSSALNEFSRLKGPDISPDGLLGGIGYILPVQEIKQTIYNSVQSLSNVADSIADEMSNPKWNAVEDKEVKKLIKEKDEAVDQAEEEMEEDSILPEDVITINEITSLKDSDDEAGRVLSAAVRQCLKTGKNL